MSAVEIGTGARATEARLLELVAEHRERTRSDPALLARPLRIVVPSRSLRLHLGERIAAELGAVAGVALQTLHGAAVEILERAGDGSRGADALVDLLARRFARDEAALSGAFEPFREGYRAVSSSVRDLLDAGLDEGVVEPAVERLRELRLLPARRERAEAAVRTAGRVARALEERGTGGRAELLRRAREAFERDPDATLPARALIVHGFADATGRASDLLASLVRKLDATFLLDHPADPDDPQRTDLGAVYTERLLERIRGVAGEPRRAASAADGRPAPRLFRAPGADAEAREVARRVRALLDGGARAERIGVVARDLSSYATGLRAHLGRLGVPHSALRARAPLDGEGRRIVALAELLEEREAAPADRWLDAVRRLELEEGTCAPSARLRLGLRVVGAARLADVAEIDPGRHLDEKDLMRLPVRTGLGGTPDEDGDGNGEERRRFHVTQSRLRGEELRAAVRASAALVRRWRRWPAETTAAEHARQLERLRRKDLGWRRSDRFEQRVEPIVEHIVESLGDETLTAEEFRLVLRRELLDRAAPSLGGEGGGVQVLDAMEARARTFEHLFVVGLNRDLFPRVASEDALLGDDLRRALRDLLPDVPIKARARDEDRYLFAQLVSAGEHVVLSWQLADDDGKARVISPLVERLLREEDESRVAAAPPIFPAGRTALPPGPHTAHEHAVLAGLAARRDGLARHLPAALEEAGLAPERARAVAAARAEVALAWDLGPFEPWRLGPWLGFLGAQDGAGARPDPRAEPPYVTRLENLASCPWQMVLTKLLRLEEAPDPLDGLPAIEARAVGLVVHEVLERIATERLGELGPNDLEHVLEREPIPVPFPDGERLGELLEDVVRERVRRERAPLPGLVRSIAAVARPKLDRARDFLEDERRRHEGSGVLGVEVEGRARFPVPDGGSIDVVFRADRVDRVGERVVLTDFKTGKKRYGRDRERKAFLKEQLPRGRALQPIAYALGAAGGALEPDGRYLFLGGDDLREPAMDIGLAAQHESHLASASAAVGTLARAWLAGAFFPRVVSGPEEREPEACRFCDVAQACVRGDSGARRALISLATESPSGDAERAMQALYRLADAEREEADE